MSNVALNTAGEPILADRISLADWDALKAHYRLEMFRMPCCLSPATLKTSSNGLPFFAHYSGECATAPETIWHREAKALIVANLAVLGFESREEVLSENKDVLWKADTYFEVGRHRIVIELQRSYQHLKDFLRRQQRYVDAGVQSYWLLRQNNFSTLMRALGKYRLKRDFGGKFPDEGYFCPCIPELPVAYLVTDDQPMVAGVDLFQTTLREWLGAVIEQRFQWNNGVWMISLKG